MSRTTTGMSSLDDNGVPVIGKNIHYEEVDALSQKRIIAFFNEFLCQTATFLNKFSGHCEEKLLKVEGRLEKLETLLSILESKLSSVPVLPKPSSSNSGTTAVKAVAESIDQPQATSDAQPSQEAAKDATSESNQVPLSSVEPYRRYFRMLAVGVPAQAVRLKMQQEHVDPSLLDRGDDLVPAPGAGVPSMAPSTRRRDSDSWSAKSSGSEASSGQ